MSIATLPTLPATAALRQSPLPALRRLAVHETAGEVVITGNVASYYLKQLAQEAVRPALDGRLLRNRVVVESN